MESPFLSAFFQDTLPPERGRRICIKAFSFLLIQGYGVHPHALSRRWTTQESVGKYPTEAQSSQFPSLIMWRMQLPHFCFWPPIHRHHSDMSTLVHALLASFWWEVNPSSWIPDGSQALHLFILLEAYADSNVAIQLWKLFQGCSPARSLIHRIYIKSLSSSGPVSHNCNLFLSKVMRSLIWILNHHWYYLKKVVGTFASCLPNIDSTFTQKYKL